MLKQMLTPIIMGVAFIGMAATVNASELPDGVLAEVGDGIFIQVPTDCEECAGNIWDMKELVTQLGEHCADLEHELQEMRHDCKGHTGGLPFSLGCDAYSKGMYLPLLAARQDCRDDSGDLVKVRNKVEHYCYGAPLYCGKISGFPEIYW